MKNLKNTSELWNSFKKGNKKSFETLYQSNIKELINYGYRVTNNKDFVRDGIQDLFLDLWKQRENLSPTNSIQFYLFRALRNRILRNISKEDSSRFTLSEFDHKLIENIAEVQNGIENDKESPQYKQLYHAVANLPKRQQEAIQLRYYHEFELEEIASIMEINNQSVRNMLFRAIAHLRNVIKPLVIFCIYYELP